MAFLSTYSQFIFHKLINFPLISKFEAKMSDKACQKWHTSLSRESCKLLDVRHVTKFSWPTKKRLRMLPAASQQINTSQEKKSRVRSQRWRIQLRPTSDSTSETFAACTLSELYQGGPNPRGPPFSSQKLMVFKNLKGQTADVNKVFTLAKNLAPS